MNKLFYLDLSDEGFWMIKRGNEKWYAGKDKPKVVALINRLNEAHRPNIRQTKLNEIEVCWNDHEKHDGCEWVLEIGAEKDEVVVSAKDEFIKTINFLEAQQVKPEDAEIFGYHSGDENFIHFQKGFSMAVSQLMVLMQQLVLNNFYKKQ